jgi:DNA-directed RNA polymerase subunit RPC12/RpoP
MNILLKQNIIDCDFYNMIVKKINAISKNKSIRKNISLHIIPLSGKKFTIKISEKEIYSPLYFIIKRVIKYDIKHNFFNQINKLYNNYFKCFDLVFMNKKISVSHILNKCGFCINNNDILYLYPNTYSLSRNFEMSSLSAKCPITYEFITCPYVCEKCNNSFEESLSFATLITCPMCRKENFYKMKLSYFSVCPSTLDLYWKQFTIKQDLFIIFFKLEIYLSCELNKYNNFNDWQDFYYNYFNIKNFSYLTKKDLYILINKNIKYI